MPDFKLISADSHVNEPPAAWERVQKEYGERAPKVVRDPAGVPKGIWLIIDGLPPVGLSHYSKGLAVGKNRGISEVDQEKHFETIRFNETFRYEDYRGGWEPSARLARSGHRRRRSRSVIFQRRAPALQHRRRTVPARDISLLQRLAARILQLQSARGCSVSR